MFNLSLYNNEILEHYKSNSQIARRLTEGWCSSEMYCPACLNENLSNHPNNQKVSDFFCERCKSEFQLKGSSSKFGRRITDGAYGTMIEFINSNRTPNFLLMHYSKDNWVVKNLFLVPKFFISSSAIEMRTALSSTARRAGWVGCNILLTKIPENGKIPIIKDERIIDKTEVHKNWEKMNFLNSKKPDFRGWTLDVLKSIEDLRKEEFTLEDTYKNKEYLSELHPDNHHIEAKIRQQLQILRDNNILQFTSKGKYKLLK